MINGLDDKSLTSLTMNIFTDKFGVRNGEYNLSHFDRALNYKKAEKQYGETQKRSGIK